MDRANRITPMWSEDTSARDDAVATITAAPERELHLRAYEAFNARDIDAVSTGDDRGCRLAERVGGFLDSPPIAGEPLGGAARG